MSKVLREPGAMSNKRSIEQIKQQIIDERDQRLSEMPKLERRFLRRIEGALGSRDEGLIHWDLMRDYPELAEQLAALAVRVYRRGGAVAAELFTGEDPGDEAQEQAEWEAR
jgi:hypothetical protein